MSIETYSELQAAIADLLNRSDLAAQIPNWISLCEAALNRDLDCPQMQVTTTITITGETYPLPADFGGVKSLRINSGAGSPVEYVTPDILDDLAIMTGTPTAYTISGDFFYFNPAKRMTACLPGPRSMAPSSPTSTIKAGSRLRARPFKPSPASTAKDTEHASIRRYPGQWCARAEGRPSWRPDLFHPVCRQRA